MRNDSNGFIWYELMTTDPDMAATFYGAVVGWSIVSDTAADPDGQDYRLILRDDGGHAGGVLELTQEMRDGGALPAWLPYLHTPNVDEAIRAIEAEGGRVLMPARTLPVGRFAMLADPQGIPIYVMDPIPPEGAPESTSDVFSPDVAQRVSWNELASPDLASSKAFYAAHFGFEFNETMDMGALGDYCFIDHGNTRLGGMMQHREADEPARWLPYFRVPDIAGAQAAVTAQGGVVSMGPQEVPGGDWIIMAADPQGAAFGLVSSKA